MQCTVTQEQIKLLQELSKRGSMDSISRCVKGIECQYFQTYVIALATILKSCIISVDTGLGKTAIAAGIMNINRAPQFKNKWLFICQAANGDTLTEELMNRLYNSKIVFCNDQRSVISNTFIRGGAAVADVLILTFEAICEPIVNGYLFAHISEISGIIVDESHTRSRDSSYVNKILTGLCNSVEFKYFLTATPVTCDIEQEIQQVYMLDRQMFSGMDLDVFTRNFCIRDEQGKLVGYRNLADLKNLFMMRVVSLSRKDVGLDSVHHPHIIWCDPKQEYLTVKKSEIFKRILGDPQGPALKAAINYVVEMVKHGKRGLIYANLNQNKQMLSDALKSLGIKVEIFDGTHTNTVQKKQAVQSGFNSHELYDVLISNLKTSKNLQCDFILYYELTVDVKQFNGRSERGFERKHLDIAFILVKDTAEIQYFYENVYKRGVLLEELCDKDAADLEVAMAEIRKAGQIYDTSEFI